jgi:hypothetical protein
MGIVVNKQPGVSKEYLRATRSGIHKLRTKQIRPDLIESYIRSIRGRIAYVNQTNPSRAANFRAELNKLLA